MGTALGSIVMGGKSVIGDQEALRVRRQWEREVLPKLECDQAVYEAVRGLFQRVSEGRLEETTSREVGTNSKPKRDLAEEYRQWFQEWYCTLGFAITVSKPAVSNREFARRTKLGQSLFYRPPTAVVPHEGFMTAVGQGNHWIVTDEAGRAKIGWEYTATGYWFWAEAMEEYPRLRTSWNDLMRTAKLLSLEEYVIVWHAMRAESGVQLDRHFWTWLRTRFGQGALGAYEHGGVVHVRTWLDPNDLVFSYDDGGGRSAEVVG